MLTDCWSPVFSKTHEVSLTPNLENKTYIKQNPVVLVCFCQCLCFESLRKTRVRFGATSYPDPLGAPIGWISGLKANSRRPWKSVTSSFLIKGEVTKLFGFFWWYVMILLYTVSFVSFLAFLHLPLTKAGFPWLSPLCAGRNRGCSETVRAWLCLARGFVDR